MEHRIKIYRSYNHPHREEYLKDEGGNDMIFDNQQAARDYLHSLGYQESHHGTFEEFFFDPIVGAANPDVMEEKNVMQLMGEVTKAACRDYVANLNRKDKDGEDIGTRKEIERYFHGTLFGAAYDLDGDYIIRELRKQRMPRIWSRKLAEQGRKYECKRVFAAISGDADKNQEFGISTQ